MQNVNFTFVNKVTGGTACVAVPKAQIVNQEEADSVFAEFVNIERLPEHIATTLFSAEFMPAEAVGKTLKMFCVKLLEAKGLLETVLKNADREFVALELDQQGGQWTAKCTSVPLDLYVSRLNDKLLAKVPNGELQVNLTLDGNPFPILEATVDGDVFFNKGSKDKASDRLGKMSKQRLKAEMLSLTKSQSIESDAELLNRLLLCALALAENSKQAKEAVKNVWTKRLVIDVNTELKKKGGVTLAVFDRMPVCLTKAA